MPFFFTVNDQGAVDAGQSFIGLVNGWLAPVRCRFDITPRPGFAPILGSAANGLAVAGPAYASPGSVREQAGVTRTEGRGVLLGLPDRVHPGSSWRMRFALALRGLLREQQRVNIRLSSCHAFVRVGQFAPLDAVQVPGGTIDVADLSRLPEQTAAGALIHELEEQRQRQARGVVTFAAAHGSAVIAEAGVADADRVAEFEPPAPGGDLQARGGRWEWWLVYRPRGRSFLRPLVLEMNGLDVVRAEFMRNGGAPVTFPNLAAVEQAASRRGLRRVWPLP